MSKNTVLLTGSSGFIGSSIVRYLADSGLQLIPTSRRNVDTLSAELDLRVYHLDLAGNIANSLKDLPKADTLVHCATPNDIASRNDDGGLHLGVTCTYQLFESAVRLGIKRLIYFSTLQVYGTELEGNINECSPVKLETPYALNHFLGEEVCRHFAHKHGIDVVILRPSNVYGVPSVSTFNRFTLVPMCFVRCVAEKGMLELKSSGMQVRNFVSTFEVASAVEGLLGSFPSGFNVINIVSTWHPRILDVSRMVRDVWQSCYNVEIPIQILSDQPSKTIPFNATSAELTPRLSSRESQQSMLDVIAELAHHPQFAKS